MNINHFYPFFFILFYEKSYCIIHEELITSFNVIQL